MSAQAAVTRTWVSGVGNDANPCSRTAPCRTFAAALVATSDSGEISVLDPGSFGTVTITKSVTINGKAQISAITASSVNGITINAAADDIVILRDLDINGMTEGSPGLNGIRFLAGKTLSVENCNIHGFRSLAAGNGRGILIAPAGAVTVNVFVSNTTITNGSSAGIAVAPAAAGPTVNLLVNKTIIKQLDAAVSTSGIFAGFGARVIVRNSELSGAGVAGIDAANDAVVLVDNSKLMNNARGVQAAGTSVIRLSRSVIAHNATAGFVEGGSGSVESMNDNVFMNNGPNVGTLSDVLPD